MEDATLYKKVKCLYSRDNIDILSIRNQVVLEFSADVLISQLVSTVGQNIQFGITKRCIGDSLSFELSLEDSKRVGCLTKIFEPTEFDLWFILVILSNGQIYFEEDELFEQYEGATDKITDLFAKTIKNKASDDRWDNVGIHVFKRNVEFFTRKGLPVEAVLPAFPCKSSNSTKVASGLPDKGEELALRRIMKFVSDVALIYPPGLKFYIVSDGHVFSDCINVDDDIVDEYTTHLIELYEKIKDKDFEGIYFKGLNDCFRSENKAAVEGFLQTISIDHHLQTKLDPLTEDNRKVLIYACDNDNEKLKQDIKDKNHPRLFLHRGFMKFMCEDLNDIPMVKTWSNKKFKKVVSHVAFEMIKRNDAYSNLVELVFPFHVRLSIHAHHNDGPKFGIKLLDKEECTTIGHIQLKEDGMLHIPTPWHNAIFKLSDCEKYIVSFLRMASELINDYQGGWSEIERCYVFTK